MLVLESVLESVLEELGVELMLELVAIPPILLASCSKRLPKMDRPCA